jgi:uncharacterized protein (TIGR03067 family)
MATILGTWKCTSAVVDGKPIPPEMIEATRLTLTDDIYRTTRGTLLLFQGVYRVDDRGEPARFDILPSQPGPDDHPAQGIYTYDGTTLTLCYTMPGGHRPEAFASEPGSGVHLASWERDHDAPPFIPGEPSGPG